jgi:predicted RNase H-like nuclease (RuvC/YqgF family)
MESDHDLLIQLTTIVRGVAEKQDKFIDRYETRHLDLSKRVAILENQDSRDSEKFKGLAEEIRRSLNNASRIDTLGSDLNGMGIKLENLSQDVGEMRKKSNLLDTINAIGVMVSGIIGYIFGNK